MQLPPPFEPVVPDIHSSDYRTALSDPFMYFLTRRLGITRALSSSQALSRGSWFHAIAELDTLQGEPGHPTPLTPSHPTWGKYLSLVADRIQELTETCATLGIVADGRRAILAIEQEDALTALAWYCSASTVEITPKLGTFRRFLSEPFWTVLGREIPISSPLFFQGHKNRSRTTLDVLTHDKGTNLLWVVDYKSCSESTKVRLASCPIEFQTYHNISLLQDALREGTIHRVFPDLPKDVQVGGMMHIAIQKPSLRFGQQDRNFTLDTSPFKSGPRKGQPRNEKNYFGDPDPANFRLRCDDWYNGRGEYSHLQTERDASPVVNISYTYARKLDDNDWNRYTQRLGLLLTLATQEPDPSLFHMSEELAPYSTLSPFAPFYLLPPSQWPEVLQQEGFIIRHRHTLIKDHPHALHTEA